MQQKRLLSINRQRETADPALSLGGPVCCLSYQEMNKLHETEEFI